MTKGINVSFGLYVHQSDMTHCTKQQDSFNQETYNKWSNKTFNIDISEALYCTA